MTLAVKNSKKCLVLWISDGYIVRVPASNYGQAENVPEDSGVPTLIDMKRILLQVRNVLQAVTVWMIYTSFVYLQKGYIFIVMGMGQGQMLQQVIPHFRVRA